MIGDDPKAYAFEEDGHRVPAEEFDYASVERELFGNFEGTPAELTPADVDRALRIVRIVLSWIWQSGMKNAEGLKIRAIIICWIFLKELRPMSLTELARGFGMKKQSLGRWHDQFKESFKIRTPHMR